MNSARAAAITATRWAPWSSIAATLAAAGYAVEASRRTQQIARIRVRTVDGHQVDIDIRMDWREAEPVTLDVGRVRNR